MNVPLGLWAAVLDTIEPAVLDTIERWHRRHCHCGSKVPPGRGPLRSAGWVQGPMQPDPDGGVELTDQEWAAIQAAMGRGPAGVNESAADLSEGRP